MLGCEVDEGVRVFSPLDTSSSDADIKKLWKSLKGDRKALRDLGPIRNYKNPYRQFYFSASHLGNGMRG